MRSSHPATILAFVLIGAFWVPASGLAQNLELACGEVPQPIVKVKPNYPPAGLEDGITGRVTVAFTIDERGVPTEIEVVDSSDSLFEQAAVEAVRKWKYRPCAGGEAIRETFEFSTGAPEEE